MKWSLLVGRFWGTEIRLHASLLLLIPYALLAFQPSNLVGSVRVLLLIAAIFACVGLHEIGHTIAARLFGIQVSSIVLWPLGGFASLNRRPEKVLPDLIISAAGPLANLLIAAFLAVITMAERIVETSPALPQVAYFLYAQGAFPFLFSLTLSNLGLALFNLVPIYPLDGGQIARGVLKALFGEKRADFFLMLFSLPLSLALVAAGLITGDIIIILTGLLMVLAGATLNLRLSNNLTIGILFFLDRGGYYLKRSDFDPALRAYTRAIQRSPNRAGLYISRAVVNMNLYEIDEARADTERALTLDQKSAIAWVLRGELAALGKDFPSALAAFNRAVELRPNWSIAYVDRGSVFQEMGDLPRALADMDKSIELGRGSPVTYVLRSLLRYEMGDLEGSRRDADQAFRYAPMWMLVFPEVFLTNLEGHLNWALDYYGRAIERMPGAYQCYQGRADACRTNHRPDWAIEDYHRAIRLAPREAELYLGRGLAYRETGAEEQAAEDFRRAAQLAERAHIRRKAQALLNSPAAAPSGSPPARATGVSAASPAPAAPVEPPEEAASSRPAAG